MASRALILAALAGLAGCPASDGYPDAAVEPDLFGPPVEAGPVDAGADQPADYAVQDCPDGWCLIPAGTFMMGSPPDEPCRGQSGGKETLHQVTLTRSYWLSATEVTQAQFEEVMGFNPSQFSSCPDCPVDSVSWHEAAAYCNALSEHAGLESCYECEVEHSLRSDAAIADASGPVDAAMPDGSGDAGPDCGPYPDWNVFFGQCLPSCDSLKRQAALAAEGTDQNKDDYGICMSSSGCRVWKGGYIADTWDCHWPGAPGCCIYPEGWTRQVLCEDASSDGTGSCLGYRLPTEAEWERAYRAGSEAAYYSGNDCPSRLVSSACVADPDIDLIAWYCANSDAVAHPVGCKRPNAWGLFDMAGNALEWVYDWYEADLGAASVDDPTGPATGTYHGVRGGGHQAIPASLRAASRGYGRGAGFRCARSRPPP